jgi:hypothetical protein
VNDSLSLFVIDEDQITLVGDLGCLFEILMSFDISYIILSIFKDLVVCLFAKELVTWTEAFPL